MKREEAGRTNDLGECAVVALNFAGDLFAANEGRSEKDECIWGARDIGCIAPPSMCTCGGCSDPGVCDWDGISVDIVWRVEEARAGRCGG